MANKRTFEQIKAHAEQLRQYYGKRDEMYKSIDQIYLLQDNELPQEDWIKPTLDPDPRNAVIGAARLLTATAPAWTAPYDVDEAGAEEKASKIEKWCSAVWAESNRVRGRKAVEYEAALSSLLYDEVHVAVMSTKEMAELSDDPRVAVIAKRTPVLFEVLPARLCYPEFDTLGMGAHYSLRKLAVADIKARWGEDAPGVEGKKETDPVEYHEYWDTVQHAVWIESSAEPILLVDHGLPQIPIACTITEGSELFVEEDQQTRQPMLYSEVQTKLWQRRNLALTVINSLVLRAGLMPIGVVEQRNETDTVELDMDVPFGVALIPPGAKWHAMDKQLIDPSVMAAFQMDERKSEESTIFKTALGQNIGAGAAYSTVALLSQAGRLPLVTQQKSLSALLGKAMEIALQITRKHGGKSKVAARGERKTLTNVELAAADIPEDLELDCMLEIDLPQDDRQNAQLVQVLTGGDFPATSLRYAREKILKAGQSDDMDAEIWSERAAYAMFQVAVQDMMQKLQAMAQQQPPQPGQLPPGAPPSQPPQQPGMGTMPPQMGMPAAGPMDPMQAGAPGQGAPGASAMVPPEMMGGM